MDRGRQADQLPPTQPLTQAEENEDSGPSGSAAFLSRSGMFMGFIFYDEGHCWPIDKQTMFLFFLHYGLFPPNIQVGENLFTVV